MLEIKITSNKTIESRRKSNNLFEYNVRKLLEEKTPFKVSKVSFDEDGFLTYGVIDLFPSRFSYVGKSGNSRK